MEIGVDEKLQIYFAFTVTNEPLSTVFKVI